MKEVEFRMLRVENESGEFNEPPAYICFFRDGPGLHVTLKLDRSQNEPDIFMSAMLDFLKSFAAGVNLANNLRQRQN